MKKNHLCSLLEALDSLSLMENASKKVELNKDTLIKESQGPPQDYCHG